MAIAQEILKKRFGSDLINNNKVLTIKLISNQKAIVGGLLFAKQTFSLIDNKTKHYFLGYFNSCFVINCG